MSELPGSPRGEPDLASIPLETRLSSSTWQHRVHAYHELKSLFETSTEQSLFSDYREIVIASVKKEKIAKVVCESLTLLSKFVQKAPSLRDFDFSVVTTLVVKKAFGQNKSCVEAAIGCIGHMMEISHEGEVILEALIGAFRDKKWKIVHSSLECILLTK